MTDLNIPRAAVDAAVRKLPLLTLHGQVQAALEVAAPAIVAAELERLADWYWPADVVDADEEAECVGVRSMCNSLRLRAADLRGGS